MIQHLIVVSISSFKNSVNAKDALSDQDMLVPVLVFECWCLSVGVRVSVIYFRDG